VEFNDIDPRDSEAIAEYQAQQKRDSILKVETQNALHTILLSPEGEKLVQFWIDTYVMGQIAMPNDTNVQIGIRQGQANFVLHIKRVLEQLKKGVENG